MSQRSYPKAQRSHTILQNSSTQRILHSAGLERKSRFTSITFGDPLQDILTRSVSQQELVTMLREKVSRRAKSSRMTQRRSRCGILMNRAEHRNFQTHRGNAHHLTGSKWCKDRYPTRSRTPRRNSRRHGDDSSNEICSLSGNAQICSLGV